MTAIATAGTLPDIPAVEAFFTRTANGFTPTELPTSPWNRETLNGVAIAGLLAHLLETEARDTGIEMMFSRLTIDLLGTVAATELTPRVTLIRPGSRMQILQAELLVGDRVAARAQGLRVRLGDAPRSETPVGYDGPDAYPPKPRREGVLKHTDRRTIIPIERSAGPAAIWSRFEYELIAGVALTPLVRLAMLADYGGGTGPMITDEPYSWPNIDITLYITRPPVGEWLMAESETESAGNGIGHAITRIADRGGTVARSLQTLYLERGELRVEAT